MTYSSEPAPKTTAWGAMMSHGLALPVLLGATQQGQPVAVLCCGVASALLSLPRSCLAGTASF